MPRVRKPRAHRHAGAVCARAVERNKCYTGEPAMALAAARVAHLLPTVVFVDFSAGDNRFVERHLRERCPAMAMDVDPHANSEGLLEVRDFLRDDTVDVVRAWADGYPDRDLMVGLNPPFGYQGQLARQFVRQAERLVPRYMLLILPYMGNDERTWLPTGFGIVSKEPVNDFVDTRGAPVNMPAHLYLLSTDVPAPTAPIVPVAPRVPGLVLRRPGAITAGPCLAVRRAGVNAGRQVYVVYADTGPVAPDYINERAITHARHHWSATMATKTRAHAVESISDSTFWKLFFEPEFARNMRDRYTLWNLANYVHTHVRHHLPAAMVQPDLNTNHLHTAVGDWLRQFN